MSPEVPTSARGWLLLIHQIPARPIYLRARIGMRLARLGAVAVKNSVYALPVSEGARDGLREVAKEIRDGGGEAFVCDARFAAADEERLVESARRTRQAEYAEVAAAAHALHGAASARAGRMSPATARARLPALQRQLEGIVAADHFEAQGRREAVAALHRLTRLAGDAAAAGTGAAPWAGRTWVTRAGVHVDRIACAWFIRRFLDSAARIRFVAPGRELRSAELGFDLPGGAFTHEDGGCSFETLLARTGRTDPALRRVAEIVHDLDLKDGRYGRPETAGIQQLLSGILAAHADDEARIERGAALLDDLHRSFQRTPVITFPRPRPKPDRG